MKKIIIGVVIVVVALIGASLFKGGSGTPEPTAGLVADRVDGPVGLGDGTGVNDEFFATLLNIRSIRIDTSLFNNPAFLYLKDHPVVLGTDTVGRPNPFAAIGTDPAPSAPLSATISSGTSGSTPVMQTQTTGVETLQPGKLTATSAELGAVVSFPIGTGPAVLVFDYGTTQEVPASTESVILENGDRVLLPLIGLSPNTRYYVRASLLYGTQTLRGSIMSFTTRAQ